MILDYQEIRKIKLSHLKHYIPESRRAKNMQLHQKKYSMDENFSDSEDSKHHYKLLAYISKQKNNQLIYELGTHLGLSATALSVNDTNKIVTYDITDYTDIKLPDNVEQRVGNIFHINKEAELLTADIIFLDTAHEGDFEYLVYSYLKEKEWKGILILDDINFNNPMKHFWNSIDTKKYDVTAVGHREDNTGTGIVDFNNQITIRNK